MRNACAIAAGGVEIQPCMAGGIGLGLISQIIVYPVCCDPECGIDQRVVGLVVGIIEPHYQSREIAKAPIDIRVLPIDEIHRKVVCRQVEVRIWRSIEGVAWLAIYNLEEILGVVSQIAACEIANSHSAISTAS